MLIVACGGDNEDASETPEGDPAQAARAFMSAFLNGETDSCVSLSIEESRDSVSELCQRRSDLESTASLRNTTFVEINRNGSVATIELQGTFQESFVDPESGAVQTRETSGPIRIQMRYQNDFWRFDNFVDDS